MTQPWYRQFWPWFIIALPCAAVIGSIATAIIASQDGVNLVAEDYYKQGKEINQDLSKFDRAEALGIRIELTVNDKELTLKPLSGELPPGAGAAPLPLSPDPGGPGQRASADGGWQGRLPPAAGQTRHRQMAYPGRCLQSRMAPARDGTPADPGPRRTRSQGTLSHG